MSSDFIILECCDFEQYPSGGSLSLARHLLSELPNVALCGFTRSASEPLGRWSFRTYSGRKVPFFGFQQASQDVSRPLVPLRLTSYLWFRRYRARFLAGLPSRRIFTQSPQLLLALRAKDNLDICFCFAGISNSVSVGRFPVLRRFGGIYERFVFSKLRASTTRILAAASRSAIEDACRRTPGLLEPSMIGSFPTRFDASVFHPRDNDSCKAALGLPYQQVTYLACGRLAAIKGWDFVLAAFRRLLLVLPEARLIFVGDGEDRARLEAAARDLMSTGRVVLTGRLPPERVALWLNACDALVLGSHSEGWPTVVVEAIGCGRPVVATAVSGIRELVREGQNGFMVMERDPERFADAMIKVLSLPNVREVCGGLAGTYSSSRLRDDLAVLWPAKSNSRPAFSPDAD